MNKWTATRPSESGYYWYRVDAKDDNPMVLYVGPWPVLPFIRRGRLVTQFNPDWIVSRCGSGEAIPLRDFGTVVEGVRHRGQWLGPILPPADPE